MSIVNVNCKRAVAVLVAAVLGLVALLVAPHPAAAADATVTVAGQTRALDGTNTPRHAGQLVLYTPAWGTSTRQSHWGVEAQVVNGKVTKVQKRVGNMTIPPRGAVLSGNGAAADWLTRWAKFRAPVTLPGDPTPTPKPTPKALIGMAAPASQWDARLSETGPVDTRRIYAQLSSPDWSIDTATSEAAAGRYSILSYKVPNTDWAGVAAGKYDTQLHSLADRLAQINGRMFVTLHHEPCKDGSAADYAAMLEHALPILGAPANVAAGPIVNGNWWSNLRPASTAECHMGMSDAEISKWLPPALLRVSEVVAADTYQSGTFAKPGEPADVKIRNLSAWARRAGVNRIGVAEYNGVSAATITAAGDAILSDPRIVFGSIFNSNVNDRPGVQWQLTGDRLDAFKATVAKAHAGS